MPKIQPSFSVHIKTIEKFDTSLREVEISNLILAMCDELSINIEYLNKVIFAQDYVGEIELQMNGTGNKYKRTETELGSSHAVTVPLIENNSLRIVMLIDLCILLCRLDPKTQDDKEILISYLNHELLHVEDFGNLFRLFGPSTFENKWKGPDVILMPLLGMMWSEYYAHRMSKFETVNRMNKTLISFCHKFDVLKEFIDLEILSYRTHYNFNVLFEKTLNKINVKLLCLSRMLGDIDVLNTTINDAITDEYKNIKDSVFFYSCNKIHEILRDMFLAYPDWKSFDIFDDLKDVVDNIYFTAGFELTEKSDGSCFISVPFRPENTPD